MDLKTSGLEIQKNPAKKQITNPKPSFYGRVPADSWGIYFLLEQNA